MPKWIKNYHIGKYFPIIDAVAGSFEMEKLLVNLAVIRASTDGEWPVLICHHPRS